MKRRTNKQVASRHQLTRTKGKLIIDKFTSACRNIKRASASRVIKLTWSGGLTRAERAMLKHSYTCHQFNCRYISRVLRRVCLTSHT